jgi:AcrR family transcriptional regulator
MALILPDRGSAAACCLHRGRRPTINSRAKPLFSGTSGSQALALPPVECELKILVSGRPALRIVPSTNDSAPADPKPPRRSQAERSATTRGRLIAATIDALHRFGYSATSTTLVAELAGVSRGAMLHQFPSKVALIAGVAEALIEADAAHYAEGVLKAATPQDRAVAMVDAGWERFSTAPGMAQTEIWMACRSDPELAATLQPIYVASRQRQEEVIRYISSVSGLTDVDGGIALLTTVAGTLRGLAVELAMGASEARLLSCVALLRDMVRIRVANLEREHRDRLSRGG